jgi:hypothetical protein
MREVFSTRSFPAGKTFHGKQGFDENIKVIEAGNFRRKFLREMIDSR